MSIQPAASYPLYRTKQISGTSDNLHVDWPVGVRVSVSHSRLWLRQQSHHLSVSTVSLCVSVSLHVSNVRVTHPVKVHVCKSQRLKANAAGTLYEYQKR